VAELPALAGGDPEPLLDALEAYSRRRLVALVGHEPQLSSLLALLLGTRDAERLTFRKGGAALVDLPRGPRESGRLLWYLPPRLLRLF
jgi:phosphohistidine phosphatase